MPDDPILVPGARDVRGDRDGPADTDRIVVACPPHPQFGGNRHDRRLRAVADALAATGIATLRIDYGDWDAGYGEREDARNACRWAADRYDRIALFGYSFGGAIALLAAASVEVPAAGVATLAPASRLADDLDAAAAVAGIDAPLCVCYGVRDETADWEPVVDAAREHGATAISLSADHHFVGRNDAVAAPVATFLDDAL
ncbi:alpha/beta hydrolase [Halobacteriales archaeon SW_7_68_16]|nr:MAG: alpha/beta hydrolase [Halobacteriales archaeon SW_7_68_16]